MRKYRCWKSAVAGLLCLGMNIASELVQKEAGEIIMLIIINMLMPVQENSFTHLRVLLVLADGGIFAQ
jgi:hypothetical protein